MDSLEKDKTEVYALGGIRQNDGLDLLENLNHVILCVLKTYC